MIETLLIIIPSLGVGFILGTIFGMFYAIYKNKTEKLGRLAELDFISDSIKDVTSKVGFSTPMQAVDFCLDIINQRKKVLGGKHD